MIIYYIHMFFSTPSLLHVMCCVFFLICFRVSFKSFRCHVVSKPKTKVSFNSENQCLFLILMFSLSPEASFDVASIVWNIMLFSLHALIA